MYHPKNPCKQTKRKITLYLFATHKPFLIENQLPIPIHFTNRSNGDYLDKYVFSHYDKVFLMSGTILDKNLFSI